MKRLTEVLEAESYNWLSANFPDVCEAVENEVAAGATPTKIKTAVLLHTRREEFAHRCFLAARHIERVN